MSNAERILAELRTPPQQEAYFLFKAIFYKYLKPLKSQNPDGNGFFSFLCKTVMMWVCEQHSPQDTVWEDRKLLGSVDMLLGKLLESCQIRTLPNYFLPEINLIEVVEDDVINQAINIVENIRSNLILYVPYDIADKVTELKEITKKAAFVMQILHALEGVNIHDDAFLKMFDLLCPRRK